MSKKSSKAGSTLTHIDASGEARMVDVSAKQATERTAVAEGHVVMSKTTLELIVSGRWTQVGQCRGQPCGWLYLDPSPTRRRRWCSMEDCGNRAKVRRFRARAD